LQPNFRRNCRSKRVGRGEKRVGASLTDEEGEVRTTKGNRRGGKGILFFHNRITTRSTGRETNIADPVYPQTRRPSMRTRKEESSTYQRIRGSVKPAQPPPLILGIGTFRTKGGSEEESSEEIGALTRWGIFKKRGIGGVNPQPRRGLFPGRGVKEGT